MWQRQSSWHRDWQNDGAPYTAAALGFTIVPSVLILSGSVVQGGRKSAHPRGDAVRDQCCCPFRKEHGETQPAVAAGPRRAHAPTCWRSGSPAVGPSLSLSLDFIRKVEKGHLRKPVLPSRERGMLPTSAPSSSTCALVGQAEEASGLGTW